MDPPGIGHGIKKLFAGAVVCEGHGAPVQAPARPAQLLVIKHRCFRPLFFQDSMRGLQFVRRHGGSCTMGNAQKCCFGGQRFVQHWVLEKRSRRSTTAVLLVFAVRVFFVLMKNSTFNGNGRPHTQTHAQTHTHTHTHTDTHTDTHTHTQLDFAAIRRGVGEEEAAAHRCGEGTEATPALARLSGRSV